MLETQYECRQGRSVPRNLTCLYVSYCVFDSAFPCQETSNCLQCLHMEQQRYPIISKQLTVFGEASSDIRFQVLHKSQCVLCFWMNYQGIIIMLYIMNNATFSLEIQECIMAAIAVIQRAEQLFYYCQVHVHCHKYIYTKVLPLTRLMAYGCYDISEPCKNVYVCLPFAPQ